MAITLSCIDEIDYGASGRHTFAPKFRNTTQRFNMLQAHEARCRLALIRVNGKSLTLILTWLYWRANKNNA